ncbi:hypothetical protein O9K51_02304 [Purpureocillium lavendulum]|uniref:Uncharacterized protein n=1 Tax=Purpureocillium lavendulum TaxID=1247861 RepID=A0AB34FZP2_9HYPO|nr:hypothetical protein O9K51_02304 [Purpureocillium lavendulum]
MPATPLIFEPRSLTAPTATRPMRIRFATGGGRKGNPIFPATMLRLSYGFYDQADQEFDIFCDDVITPRDVMPVEDDRRRRSSSSNSAGDGEDKNNNDGTVLPVYSIEVPSGNIPRVPRCKPRNTNTKVVVYAWRQEKLLDSWVVGEFPGLSAEEAAAAKAEGKAQSQAQAQAQAQRTQRRRRGPQRRSPSSADSNSSGGGEWEQI